LAIPYKLPGPLVHEKYQEEKVCYKRQQQHNSNNNKNWKAPGRDQIPNFWLKQFTATHKHVAAMFNQLLEEDQIPEWLTAGITFLIPKNENTEHLKNYRPVTCLPTTYKLLNLL
jgi:hypothetical protein